MLTKIEWESSDKFNSRILEWDEEIPDFDEMKMIVESGTKNKVKKIYLNYQPTPQYLNLFAEIYFDNQQYKQRLILHLSPDRNIKTDRSLLKIKCFGKSPDAEMIFESIRLTYCSAVEEKDENTLYFEEFKLNANGEQLSILMILLSIYQIATNYSSVSDHDTTQLEQLLLDNWNKMIEESTID